jgi:predicted Zn finger-like uncharacterized protein
MFTVCPKCALTLVVTAADLRVAQGYVRCGRCSNVFNAIVGLSDDRQNQSSASGSTPASTSTASTSIIRKAPSIDDETLHDPLSDTGETEAIYAEPDAHEVKFQELFEDQEEVFIEAPSAIQGPVQGPTAASRPVAAPKPAAAPKSPPPAQKSAPPKPVIYDDDSIPETALEFDPASTDVSKVFVEAPAKKIDWKREATGTFETIVLKTEDAPPDTPPPEKPRQRDPEDIKLEGELRSLAAKLDATGNQPTPRQLAANEATIASRGSPYNSADDPGNVALKAAKAAKRSASTSAEAGRKPAGFADQVIHPPTDEAGAEAAAEELAPPPAPRGRKIAWISGTVALGVVLVAQAIHHNRHDLATNARLNRPLTRFYAAIGVPLVPNWNLASYEVRQLGASTGEGDNGNLTVRASLKNAADQPLPLPLLRITVQDRYGNRIATRDVPPKGYVPGAVPEGAHLGVGQRIDAEMTFKDPGRDAVGFEIDACLPAPGGRIACANDAPAAR